MLPLSLIAPGAATAPAPVEACRVTRFACGGGSSAAAETAPEVDLSLRPELLVGALLCPALRRDEALAVGGTAHVQPDPAGVASLSIPPQTLLLLDFAGAEPPPDSAEGDPAERWLTALRRDLEKAHCAFSAGAGAQGVQCVRSAVALSRPETMALDVALQWLAASEAGCALELRLPAGLEAGCEAAMQRELRAFQQAMEAASAEARPTVGWAWARVSDYIAAAVASAGAAQSGSILSWMAEATGAGRPFPFGTAPADLAAVLAQEAADAADVAAVRSNLTQKSVLSLLINASVLPSQGVRAVNEEEPTQGGGRARGRGRGGAGGGGGGGRSLFGGADDADDGGGRAGRGLFGGDSSSEEEGAAAASSGGGGAGGGWTSSDEEESRPARRLF